MSLDNYEVNFNPYESNIFVSFFNPGSHILLISTLGLRWRILCQNICVTSFSFRIYQWCFLSILLSSSPKGDDLHFSLHDQLYLIYRHPLVSQLCDVPAHLVYDGGMFRLFSTYHRYIGWSTRMLSKYSLLLVVLLEGDTCRMLYTFLNNVFILYGQHIFSIFVERPFTQGRQRWIAYWSLVLYVDLI